MTHAAPFVPLEVQHASVLVVMRPDPARPAIDGPQCTPLMTGELLHGGLGTERGPLCKATLREAGDESRGNFTKTGAVTSLASAIDPRIVLPPSGGNM